MKLVTGGGVLCISGLCSTGGGVLCISGVSSRSEACNWSSTGGGVL